MIGAGLRAAVVPAVLAVAGAVVTAAPAAPRSTSLERTVAPELSTNWAGYAITGADPTTGAVASYLAVSGTWVQPAATCTAGETTYASFWVGLGGFATTSTALEQIGTEADCTASGRPRYSVWYELVPAAATQVKLKIAPGDTMSATVVVSGSNVTLRIKDTSRHTVFTKRLTMSIPDVSSAEWIAEAPAACDSRGRCQVLPLTNFGTVLFTRASAATVDGAAGTIANPAWSTTAIELVSDGNGPIAAPVQSSGAVPSDLSPDGTSFSVAWQSRVATS